jgi:hypothetical protein
MVFHYGCAVSRCSRAVDVGLLEDCEREPAKLIRIGAEILFSPVVEVLAFSNQVLAGLAELGGAGVLASSGEV